MRTWAHSPRELHLRAAPATRPPRFRCRADMHELVGQSACQVHQRKGRKRQRLHRVHFTPCRDQNRLTAGRCARACGPNARWGGLSDFRQALAFLCAKQDPTAWGAGSKKPECHRIFSRSNRAATCASALPEDACFHGRQQIPSTMRSGVKAKPRSRNCSSLYCFVQRRHRHIGSFLAYDESSERRSSTSFPRNARLFFFRRFIKVVKHRCKRRLCATPALHSDGTLTADWCCPSAVMML